VLSPSALRTRTKSLLMGASCDAAFRCGCGRHAPRWSGSAAARQGRRTSSAARSRLLATPARLRLPILPPQEARRRCVVYWKCRTTDRISAEPYGVGTKGLPLSAVSLKAPADESPRPHAKAVTAGLWGGDARHRPWTQLAKLAVNPFVPMPRWERDLASSLSRPSGSPRTVGTS
jgi:hypothetical protein